MALAAALAGVLQQFRAPPAPTIKLAKFMGYPMTAGDPTLVEWLDQFDAYAHQAGVHDTVRAVVLLDHLGGCAREEVLCHSDIVQCDYGCTAEIAFRTTRNSAFFEHRVPCSSAVKWGDSG